jgi:hypothetical protein
MSKWKERSVFEQETQIAEIQRPMDEDWINNLRKRNQQLYSNVLDIYNCYQNFILSKLLTFGIADYNVIKDTLNTILKGEIDHKTFRRAYNDAYAFTINQDALILAIMKSDKNN